MCPGSTRTCAAGACAAMDGSTCGAADGDACCNVPGPNYCTGGLTCVGAGGGGSVVALVDSVEQGERVVAAWQRDGFTGFVTRVRGSIERRPETVREDETEAVP